MKRAFLIKFFASGLFTGYSPIVPGTTGTIPAWLLAYFMLGRNPDLIIIFSVAFIIISVFLAGKAEPLLGHDAKKIVIDEWAGMMISLIMIPYSLTNYILAFLAFRALDAVKFFPANVAERLPRGWGVTADDVVAGIQANLLTQLLIYVGHFVTK
ncbi:MAG: phosphatidylglycerophosphatase A [candidate division Zixibacteria bacterium]|nr:phosphatidylglycerophosphatase A [candidate division Zixibacteria bacterium]